MERHARENAGIATGAVAWAIALPPARVIPRLLQTYLQPCPLVLKIDCIYGLSRISKATSAAPILEAGAHGHAPLLRARQAEKRATAHSVTIQISVTSCNRTIWRDISPEVPAHPEAWVNVPASCFFFKAHSACIAAPGAGSGSI
jgi:hypothetical protein